LKLRAAVTALLVCGVAAPHAAAAPVLTVYTDRAAWEAAVSGTFVEENLNAFNPGVSYELAPLDVGDFTISVSGDTFPGWHQVGPNNTVNDVNGTAQLNAITVLNGRTTLSFDFPVWAFGAHWAGISDSRVTSIDVDGTVLPLPNLNQAFYGFTSSAPFSSLFLSLTTGGPDGFGMDDVVYSRSAIPEPATLALVGLGLAALALRRRNRSIP
jgi:hypothetical protein